MTNFKKIIISTIGLIGGGYILYKGINKEPSKYSLEWIKNLSNEQWEKERNLIQNQFRNPELDIDFRERCHKLLELFDKVKSDKYWANKIPKGPSYSREHGYGLYKPD